MQIPSKQELEDLYFNKGFSIKKVSKELGKGHTLICGLFKEYNIPLKDRKVFSSPQQQIEAIISRFKNEDVKRYVKQWIKEKQANNKGIEYIRQKLYSFLSSLDNLDRPIKEIIEKEDKEAIIRNIEAIKKAKGRVPRRCKIELKNFFKWVNEDEHPKATKWIETKKTLQEMKPEAKVLTDKERQLILDNAPTQRDRLIFSILNENPTRPRDIVNLKVRDVEADEYGYILHLRSKTQKGFRSIRIINSVPEMRLYLSGHKDKDNPEAPLFYSLANRDNNGEIKPLQYWGMKYALEYAAKKAKIKRKVKLYDFRRTIATELLQDSRYTPKEVMVMGGWSSIKMLDVYGKVTSDMVGEKKLVISGKKKDTQKIKEDKFKPVVCARCGEVNSKRVDSCSKCWLPLTNKAVEKYEAANKVIERTGVVNVTKETLKQAIRDLITEGEIKI